MGRFAKRLIGGLAAALFVTGGAYADFMLADFNSSSNESNMGTYFYLYSSCEDDIPLLASGPGDEYGPMSYIPQGGAFEGGRDGSGWSAGLVISNMPEADGADVPCMPLGAYTNGSITASSTGGYYPGFGFGILISGDDDVGYSKFSGVDKIKFYVKTTTAPVTFIFKIETTENSPNPAKNPYAAGTMGGTPYPGAAANAYAKKYTITAAQADTWVPFEVSIKPVTPSTNVGAWLGSAVTGSAGDLKQFAYWGIGYTFDPAKVTKIAWALNAEDNEGGGEKTLYIDDVELIGSFTYTPPDLCVPENTDAPGCVTSTSFTIPDPSRVLSTFEEGAHVAAHLENARGYYWFWYTDEAATGTSSLAGLIESPYPIDIPNPEIMNVVGKGREEGNGANIEFTLGDNFSKPNDPVIIDAFVGIGTNVYQDGEPLYGGNGVWTHYLDVKNYTGVYFQYKTSSDVNYFDFEVTDDLDNKAGAPADQDGQVWYKRIPGSNGAWRSATVPFSSLVLPSWSKEDSRRGSQTAGNAKALHKDALAQLKFKITSKGVPNRNGELAIDNVYFYGSNDEFGDTEGSSVKLVGSRAKASGLRATYSRGVVGVNWNAAQSGIASGKISLVNVRGRVVASAPIKVSGSKITANLGAGTIPTGMYFVRVNAKDVKGKKIVQQASLSIVK